MSSPLESLTEVDQMLDAWWTAYNKVSRGETYSMGGRTLTRADAATCRDQIASLQRQRVNLLARRDGATGSSHSLANFTE